MLMFEGIVACQCFGSATRMLHTYASRLSMPLQPSSLSMLVLLFGAHPALGGDVRVSPHDVIDIHMEEPARGSFGMFSEATLQEGRPQAADGVHPPTSEYTLLLERQQEQTANIAALHRDAMSSTTQGGSK